MARRSSCKWVYAYPTNTAGASEVRLRRGFGYCPIRYFRPEIGHRTRGEEAQAIKREAGFRARRWVVERAHSWLNRFRRILVRWEKRADTYIAMLHLACGLIVWRATSLLE
ncbi:transposase [Azohydromonas lata]|uniref:transposase n=1 Tax=Azohydromonas lata TaxID=45677 RepID=UPI0038994D16